MTIDPQVAREWLKARNIIAAAIRDFAPSIRQEDAEHNAAAIIARLSHEGLLLSSYDEADEKPLPKYMCAHCMTWHDGNHVCPPFGKAKTS